MLFPLLRSLLLLRERTIGALRMPAIQKRLLPLRTLSREIVLDLIGIIHTAVLLDLVIVQIHPKAAQLYHVVLHVLLQINVLV